MSIDSACRVFFASVDLPLPQVEHRQLFARQAGPWVTGFGQWLQPSFKLRGVATVEFVPDRHQAGEVAQQGVRAGV